MAAWTEGVTAELCNWTMNYATENNIQYNASTAAASVVQNATLDAVDTYCNVLYDSLVRTHVILLQGQFALRNK